MLFTEGCLYPIRLLSAPFHPFSTQYPHLSPCAPFETCIISSIPNTPGGSHFSTTIGVAISNSIDSINGYLRYRRQLRYYRCYPWYYRRYFLGGDFSFWTFPPRAFDFSRGAFWGVEDLFEFSFFLRLYLGIECVGERGGRILFLFDFAFEKAEALTIWIQNIKDVDLLVEEVLSANFTDTRTIRWIHTKNL